jgi:hypothetical protein
VRVVGDSKDRPGINVNVPDDVVRNASDFLQRVLGPVANAADLLSDKLRLIRFRSALKTLTVAKKLAEQHDISLGRVSTKFLVPFLEGCSVEDEESELIRNGLRFWYRRLRMRSRTSIGVFEFWPRLMDIKRGC